MPLKEVAWAVVHKVLGGVPNTCWISLTISLGCGVGPLA